MSDIKPILALTIDGKITKCSSPSDKIGKGRCNHILHQEENETKEEFYERCNRKLDNIDKNHIIISLKNEKQIFVHEIKVDNNITYLFPEDLDMKDHSKDIGGTQKKSITVDGKYIKMDTEEIGEDGNIAKSFSYPSATEAICSLLVRNSNIQDRIRCADYHLCQLTDENYQKMSGSISYNYRKLFEVEYKAASPYGASKQKNMLMATEEYREEIYDKISNVNDKEILIAAIMKNFKCDKEKISKQFDDKCALDILFGNADVKNNPGNFIVVCENDENPDIISMDYGRCLHWGDSNTYLSPDYFKKNNFEPFEINMGAIEKEYKETKSKINNDDLSYMYGISFSNLMSNLKKYKFLWKDKKIA